MASGTAAEYSNRVGPGCPRKPSGAAGVPPQTLAGRSAGRWLGGVRGLESPQLHLFVQLRALAPRIPDRHLYSSRALGTAAAAPLLSARFRVEPASRTVRFW